MSTSSPEIPLSGSRLFSRNPAITRQRVAARLASGELVLIDVRQAAELRAGRVRDAVNIPLQLPGRLGALGSGRQGHLGLRGSRATRIATKAGYDAVNVRGGVRAWAGAGLPLTR